MASQCEFTVYNNNVYSIICWSGTNIVQWGSLHLLQSQYLGTRCKISAKVILGNYACIVMLIEFTHPYRSNSYPGLTTSEGSNSLSSQQYYSVECSGLEQRLVDCTWSIRNVKSSKKDAIALCREGT